MKKDEKNENFATANQFDVFDEKINEKIKSKKFCIQKNVIDDLVIAGYQVIIIKSHGIYIYYDMHIKESEVLPEPLPETNENYFYKLEFNTYYKL